VSAGLIKDMRIASCTASSELERWPGGAGRAGEAMGKAMGNFAIEKKNGDSKGK